MTPHKKLKKTNPVFPRNTVSDLLEGMAQTGFQGRKLGESVKVWERMIADPDCTIIFGLSGAMIPSGMGKCIVEMVKNEFVDVIVSTGANMFHDIFEQTGYYHYIGHHQEDDAKLCDDGIVRIYDVLAYDNEFEKMEYEITKFCETIAPFRGSSYKFIHNLGRYLIEKHPTNESVLTICTKKNVPLFIPAICDSSIGIGLMIARRKGVDVDVDQIADIDELTKIVEGSKKTGVVYVGGGVPKNFIQQTQVVGSIYQENLHGHNYAIQFTTDSPQWG